MQTFIIMYGEVFQHLLVCEGVNLIITLWSKSTMYTAEVCTYCFFSFNIVSFGQM